MRAVLGVFLALALTVSGCASILGVKASEIDSANKALAAATLQIDALATLTTDLVAEQVITPTQARAVATNLRTALDAVQKAQSAIAAGGDPSHADTALEITERSLDVAFRLLQAFGPRSNAVFLKERANYGSRCNC